MLVLYSHKSWILHPVFPSFLLNSRKLLNDRVTIWVTDLNPIYTYAFLFIHTVFKIMDSQVKAVLVKTKILIESLYLDYLSILLQHVSVNSIQTLYTKC